MSDQVTWGMIPGKWDIICSTEVMAPGQFSRVFLIDPPGLLVLVLHGLLWESPNIYSTQGGSFMVVLRFFGMITLFNNTMNDFNVQWFILWCQTMNYLLSCPVDLWWTTTWTCNTSWYLILPHLLPLLPSCWGVAMGYRLELIGFLLPPGYLTDPKS